MNKFRNTIFHKIIITGLEENTLIYCVASIIIIISSIINVHCSFLYRIRPPMNHCSKWTKICQGNLTNNFEEFEVEPIMVKYI